MQKKKIKMQDINIIQHVSTKVAYDSFIKSRIVKNLAENSIKYYKQNIGYFFEYCYHDNINDYSNNDIDNYIIYMKQDMLLKDVTINLRLRSIKTFFKYAQEQYSIEMVKVHLLKEDTIIKECYTKQEIQKLLVKPSLKDFHEYRNWVIVNFLLCEGVRASTLINIKVSDINFEDNTILLSHCKSRKQQIIPLASQLKAILLEYIKCLPSDSYLFPNQWGEQFSFIGLSQAIRRYNRTRGVNKTSLHLFRHTFATNYARISNDAYRLQRILGHSTQKMTNRYIHLSSQDLKEGFDEICILNNIEN